MSNSFEKIQSHSLINQIVFQLKVSLLCVRCAFENLFSKIKKHSLSERLSAAPIIGESSSELWNENDEPESWILTAGKIQNLRVAKKYLHGIEIPAGEIFSFWQHLGYPTKIKGYTLGREIREGCIVPTVAGGLCQLSNALYDAALKAKFEILERHKHSKVIQGSLAEKNRDATVKWNYVDLKFRSQHDFRIEIELTAAQLIVRFKSLDAPEEIELRLADVNKAPHALLDCFSCGETDCASHPVKSKHLARINLTAFLLDEPWKEFEHYLSDKISPNDVVVTSFGSSDFFTPKRFKWNITQNKKGSSAWINALVRALHIRFIAKWGGNVFSTAMKHDKKIAQQFAKKIPLECTHLLIAQNLLPFLWEAGVLGGRTFDVLMCRLPLDLLQTRLDLAQEKFPESQTLNDFRVAQSLNDYERSALAAAQQIITAHTDISKLFCSKSVLLDWVAPISKPTETKIFEESVIIFPAATIGRKGAYEVRQLARELNLSVVLKGPVLEAPNFWEGVPTKTLTTTNFEAAAVVVYPAYVEHQPRFILAALARGLSVVAYTGCGLAPRENLTLVAMGDYEALKQAVVQVLQLHSNTNLS